MSVNPLPRARAAVVMSIAAAMFGVASPVPAGASATPVVPDPDAPTSWATVPGLVAGAAGDQFDFPESPAQRGGEFTAAAQAPGSTTAPSSDSTNLPSWSGLFHGYWGAFPSVANSGAQATQSVNPKVQLSSSDHDTLYSPTLYPTGASCIEVSTIYAYDTTNNRPGIWVGAWDWCGTHGFHVRKPVDASFLSTYTVVTSGQDYYTIKDVLTNSTTNTWTAYLFNYVTESWDALYTSTGSSGGTNLGWQIDEVYTNYNSSTGEGEYCTQSYGADFETSALRYRIGGTWTAATPSNSGMNLAAPRGSDVGCATSGFALPNANSDFRVTNSTHAAGELIGVASDRCVDTKGAAFVNGTKEELWDCHNGPGQTWTYNAQGELTVDGGRFCLDATGHGTTNGTKIQLYQCLGGSNQEWTFGIKHTIVGIQSGKCLDAANFGTANGTQLQLYTCNATTNQQWNWG
jgi:hypothetical protein